jgi:predicted lipoprotein with Yx(FWY)xxD motif
VGESRFDAQAAKIMTKAGGTHLGMVRLKAVPGFSEILIHWGNYHTNSEGCILTGRGKMTGPDGALAVSASQDAYAAVYPELARTAHAAGPGAWLRISDKDGTGARAAPLPLARPERN